MPDPRHFDPRLGDEDAEESEHGHAPRTPAPKHVRMPSDVAQDDTEKDKDKDKDRDCEKRAAWSARIARASPVDFSWIPAHLTWSKLKPVIRCAIVCWVSAVLMIIPRTSNLMGQVSSIVIYCSRGQRGGSATFAQI